MDVLPPMPLAAATSAARTARILAGIAPLPPPCVASALGHNPTPLRPSPPPRGCVQVKEGDAFNRELQEQKRLERIAEREAKEKERK